MKSGFKQDNAYLSISTPLGADVLLLQAFHGEESVCGLFAFELEMSSSNASVDFSALIGKSGTITVTLSGGEKRHINGVFTRLTQTGSAGGFATYRATLSPWLWWLTLTTDSRIFQAKATPDIVKSVFQDLGFSDFRDELTGTYEAREYCVQYQETAFAFVSRLLEEEGIFYFFEHEDGRHTLVLADSSDAYKDCPHCPTARYRPDETDRNTDDIIHRCAMEQQAVPVKYRADDFNFETPSTELLVMQEAQADRMQVYEYPGGYAQKSGGESLAKLRLEELQHAGRSLHGDSFCRAFTAGYKFALTEHYRGDLNATYVLRRVGHSATSESYSNSFEAYPLSLPFRPPRTTRKARVMGAQTAMVTGKSGEEIWTDKYGRIKVQFHWDQLGKNDENSSCWIRVAQGWAGQGWGSLFLPRIGQEVIVSFLEGDPDRPIVTGCVYNAEKTVPYALPDEQTKSTVKSNVSKGGGGANEIRFEDKKDAEEVYVHAHKDMNISVENDRTKSVLHDETNTIKNNRTSTIQEGNEQLVVEKGDRTVQVKTGKETHEVKGERSVTVTGNETHTDSADYTHKVTGNYVLKVQGDLTIDVTGSVTIKSAQSVTTQAGTALENKAGTSLTNKAGTTMTNDAGISLTNKGAASQTVDGGGMLTVKGGLVKIN
jgi:type VI secretion system secreted protein VgrG